MSNTQHRLHQLKLKMRENNVGLVAVGPGPHMSWLLGFHPHPDERPCLLLVGQEREIILMPVLNAAGTREHTDIDFVTWSDEDGPVAALSDALSKIGAAAPGSVVLDETMRANFAFLVLDALPAATRRDFTDNTVGALRLIKDEQEFALLKMNAEIADRAMQHAFSVIRAGMSERQLAAEICEHFSSEDAVPAFWIVGAGGNSAFPHHSAGDRIIQSGDAVVIDIGASKSGYPSDITRMAIVGRVPDGYAEVHAVVEHAVQAAMAAARPGVLARDVDAAARGVITAAGFGDFFTHRTGHGMGVEGHEPPYITATSDAVLQEGMVFSIEPGIYLPGRFGIRLEEIVYLKAGGPEILSTLGRAVYRA